MASGDIEFSGSLVRQAAFATQGQVDWVGFGKTIFSASLQVMQRLAGAGIQPTTHCGGLAMASQFRLGELGSQRIENAIENLPCSPLFESIIFVGFGMQSFVKTLAETQAGVNLVALCGCLAATHSEAMAARVLAALWDQMEFPVHYKPSKSQFRQLINNCAGVCHSTTFSSTVDIMLGGRASRKRDADEDQIVPFTASAAEEIAAAIKGLFDITTNKQEQVFVTGSASSAFIAALSYWLLNLRTRVIDKDSSLIFTSFGEDEAAQVLVQYSDAHDLGDLQVMAKTYVLRPNETLVHMDDAESRMTHLVVRTPLEGCLERAFGSIVNDCFNRTRQLGAYLGSVAKIYAALANADASAKAFSRRDFTEFSPRSYGLGFIQSVETIAPRNFNMAKLKQIMETASSVSVHEAEVAAETALFDLKRACQCNVCHDESIQDYLQIRQCLPAMAMTIRKILNILATVVNKYAVEPTVFGLEEIFMNQQYEWYEALQALSGARQDDMIAAILGLRKNEANIEMHPYQDISAAMLTKDVETLFLGDSPSNEYLDRASNRTAFSKFGLCIYLHALHDISCRPDEMRQVHVVPGHISHLGRRYDEIVDSMSKNTAHSVYMDKNTLQAVTYDLIRKESVNVKYSCLEQVKMRALVTEVLDGDSLRFVYQASVLSGSVDINPALFTERLLLSSGVIPCEVSHRDHPSRSKSDLALECAEIQTGWSLQQMMLSELPHQFGVACCIWNLSNDDYARCLAFMYQSWQVYAPSSGDITREYFQPIDKRASRHVRVFLRQRQCLLCCTSHIVDTMGGFGDTIKPQDQVLVHLI